MSIDSKRKWELEYETLKTRKSNEESKKVDINAVEATLQLKRKLNQHLDKLMKDKETFETAKTEYFEETEQLKSEAKKLEEELDVLKKQEESIRSTLKDKNLSPEDRKKLENELSESLKAQLKNHVDFSKNQQNLETKEKSKPITKINFAKKIDDTKKLISRCNFIGKNLMEGKTMHEVEADLSKWETAKSVIIKDEDEQTAPDKLDIEKIKNKKERLPDRRLTRITYIDNAYSFKFENEGKLPDVDIFPKLKWRKAHEERKALRNRGIPLSVVHKADVNITHGLIERGLIDEYEEYLDFLEDSKKKKPFVIDYADKNKYEKKLDKVIERKALPKPKEDSKKIDIPQVKIDEAKAEEKARKTARRATAKEK